MDRKSRRVKFPFYEMFREAMLNGSKTKTARTRAFGKPGDWFQQFGATFKILNVSTCNLACVAKFEYKAEGLKTPEQFIEVWKKIHPRKGWVPSQVVKLHEFERMDGDNGKES